ncbi:MAG: I78 family peptidase inhibitor [Paracoccus sp. (in: a-proteobacteria)]
MVAILVVAGCTQPKLPPGTPPAPSDDCRASQFQGLVGQSRKVLNEAQLTRPVRVIGPDMAVTGDYRPDRLNIEYDDRDLITRISCY